MGYNASLRDAELEEEQRQWIKQQEAEEEYRRKLEEARDKPVLEKLHPMRRRAYQESQLRH